MSDIPDQLSHCFGTFDEADERCNGTELSDPCSLRLWCLALREHCKDAGHERGQYLDLRLLGDGALHEFARPVNHGVLQQVCQEMIGRRGIAIVDGVLQTGIHEQAEHDVFRPEPRRWWKWKGKRWTPACKNLVDDIKKLMVRQWPRFQINVTPRAIVPGQFIQIDHSWTSGSLAYYWVGLWLRKVPIIKLWVRPDTDTIDIDVPLTLDQLRHLIGKVTMTKLRLRSTWRKTGPWRSKARKQGIEGAGYMVEALGWASRTGMIDLTLYDDDPKQERPWLRSMR